ncbi:hypothetical protein Ocin01_02207 [Orchesella cincta]|uniref:Uncharacterized protein n=1 Tax=Orchesella cincta TaxID=48709 RepID=A0A1D2NGW7_ORCCI|nr:hypothetical protein Ocin01_02207 [Orchesella cincta]
MVTYKCLIAIFWLAGSLFEAHSQNLSNTTHPVKILIELSRSKRQAIYTCRRNMCRNGVCNPQHYEGPNPPSWCKNQSPHQQEIKCSWSKTCWSHNKCELTNSNCGQTFEDLRPGRKDPITTFNFSCNKRRCSIERCRGRNCADREYMSATEFQQKFVDKLPKCSDVDRGRRKRTPASVQGLLGYCCDIQQRWGGAIVGSVRPIRR